MMTLKILKLGNKKLVMFMESKQMEGNDKKVLNL